LMIHLLSQGKGVEIHGCGVLDRRGRAYVFAGQSGAGKSTLARLWAERPDVTVLSDERVVLRTDNGRITVYGTPWHGDGLLVSACHGTLAGVFFLHHAAKHATAVARRSQAAAQLLSCSFLPFYDSRAVARTIDAADRVVSGAPCFDLWFAPDRSILDFVTTLAG
jgi:predicted ATPase